MAKKKWTDAHQLCLLQQVLNDEFGYSVDDVPLERLGELWKTIKEIARLRKKMETMEVE